MALGLPTNDDQTRLTVSTLLLYNNKNLVLSITSLPYLNCYLLSYLLFIRSASFLLFCMIYFKQDPQSTLSILNIISFLGSNYEVEYLLRLTHMELAKTRGIIQIGI